jgi:CRP-like cAMP-binding protein
MTSVPQQRLRLYDIEPGLFRTVAAPRRDELIRQLTVPVAPINRGRWQQPEITGAGLGTLVVDGFLLRRFTILGRRSSDLIGPGDLIGTDETVAFGSGLQRPSWEGLASGYGVVLDSEAAGLLRLAPYAFAELAQRFAARTSSLSFLLAGRRVRASDRLLAALCHLARRWGKPVDSGLVMPLPLSHQLLADLIAVERQTVTALLKEFVRADLVVAGPDRRWIVCEAALHMLDGLLAGEAPLDLGSEAESLSGERRTLQSD